MTEVRSEIANERSMRYSNLNSFLVLGVLEAAWAPMVPFIKARFGLDEASLGWLLLCSGLGAVCFMPMAGWASSRFGARLTCRFSGTMMGLCLTSLALSHNLYLTAISLFLFGAMTICIDIGSNVNAVIVEKLCNRPLMSGFHGGYSLGTLIGAGLVSLLLTMGLELSLTAGSMLLIGVVTLAIGCRGLIADVRGFESAAAPKPAAEENAAPVSQGFRIFGIPPMVLLIGFLCFILYSAEGSVMNWGAVFANQERGIPLEYAGFMYTAFAVTMTVMRLMGNRIVVMIGRRRTVVIGTVLVCSGFMLTCIPSVVTSVMGFALIGVGAGNIVPQMVSFAGTVKGYPVHKTIASVNAVGYSGILAGPVVIGFIASHLSLTYVFFGIGILVLGVGAVSFVIMRPQAKA